MPLTILYVDDDDDIREVAELSLQMDSAIDVRTAASGAEALDVIEHWVPDVVMLDVMMPQMDGPTLLSRIREKTSPRQPVAIFITARIMEKDLAALQALDIAGIITKPFNPLTLADQVRKLTAGY